jgi:hypothetical protein
MESCNGYTHTEYTDKYSVDTYPCPGPERCPNSKLTPQQVPAPPSPLRPPEPRLPAWDDPPKGRT